MKKEDLGFMYMVLQPDPSREKIKAWLDGEESSRTIKNVEFIEMVPEQLRPSAKKVIRETSIFLWDVFADSFRRLSNKSEKIPIGEWIKNKKTETALPEKEPELSDMYYRAEFHKERLKINR